MVAVNYFLKIEGIEGESQDSQHKGEIDIESWLWSESQTSSPTGGGAGAGKVSMQDFRLTMRVNKASPKLLLACASGELLKTAILTGCKVGGKQQEFLRITFSDLLVSSFETTGSSRDDTLPRDEVSIKFSQIEYEYRPQNADGSLGNATKIGWDLKQNKPV